MKHPSQTKIIFTCFCWLLVTEASAAPRPSAKIKSAEAPEFLFHWSQLQSVNSDNKVQALSRSSLPLPSMYPTFYLVDMIPSLSHTKGLFTWSHPVGGVGTGPTEMYAANAALIMIKTKGGQHQVLEVLSVDGQKPFQQNIDTSSIDFIHHTKFTNTPGSREVIFEEWIVTSQRGIQSFTADPMLIRPIIEKQVRFMRSGKKYSERELHARLPPDGRFKSPFVNSESARKTQIIPALEQYMKNSNASIHPLWKRPFSGCDTLVSWNEF